MQGSGTSKRSPVAVALAVALALLLSSPKGDLRLPLPLPLSCHPEGICFCLSVLTRRNTPSLKPPSSTPQSPRPEPPPARPWQTSSPSPRPWPSRPRLAGSPPAPPCPQPRSSCFSLNAPSPTSTASPARRSSRPKRQRRRVPFHAKRRNVGIELRLHRLAAACASSVRISRSSPIAKPIPGALRAAQHLAQAVVAPAAQQRILRPQPASRLLGRGHGKLERRARVVVEPPHQPRVQVVLHAHTRPAPPAPALK